MTLKIGAWRYFKWPYQAKVMKILEMVKSTMLVMRDMLPRKFGGCKCFGGAAQLLNA
jgi:hypothetical protein